jgi:hypothetical protein
MPFSGFTSAAAPVVGEVLPSSAKDALGLTILPKGVLVAAV